MVLAASAQDNAELKTCLGFDTAKLLRGWQVPSESLLGPFRKLYSFLGSTASDTSPAGIITQKACFPVG